MAHRGLFITFEGGEGTGKSTHVRELHGRLVANGHQVTLTREPGGTPGAEDLRQLLVTGETGRWSPEAEALLNYAARDDHLRRVIRPALADGRIVVCDRFVDSTRAYQGYAGGCSLDLINALEAEIVGETRPDLTLVLDVDPEVGLQRANDRDAGDEDRYERMGSDFHQVLRDAFRQIAEQDPDRCVLIDTAAAKEQVADAIWQAVLDRLPS